MPFSFPGPPPIDNGDMSAASHKTWLENFLIAVQRLQAICWFGISGGDTKPPTYVIAGLNALAQGTPNMTVQVQAGAGFVQFCPVFQLAAASTSPAWTAPVSAARIDAVWLDGYTMTPQYSLGSESTPTVPASVPVNGLLLAHIHHKVGETAIVNANSSNADPGGSNGWIEDVRVL
jgi:hypothetical protein